MLRMLTQKVKKFSFTRLEMATVSTKDLDNTDLALLLLTDMPLHLANLDGDYGSMFTVPDGGLLEMEISSMAHSGFSVRFQDIIRELSMQGIPYVRFDTSGPRLEGPHSRAERMGEAVQPIARTLQYLPEDAPEGALESAVA